MAYQWIYRAAALLLTLGTLGHTLGGMIRMSRRGPGAGEAADRVLAEMRDVHFVWRGMDSSWFRFWMGNGLGVSALLVLAVALLWILGFSSQASLRVLLPVAWALCISLALLGLVSGMYFGTRLAIVWGLIAALTILATLLAWRGLPRA